MQHRHIGFPYLCTYFCVPDHVQHCSRDTDFFTLNWKQPGWAWHFLHKCSVFWFLILSVDSFYFPLRIVVTSCCLAHSLIYIQQTKQKKNIKISCHKFLIVNLLHLLNWSLPPPPLPFQSNRPTHYNVPVSLLFSCWAANTVHTLTPVYKYLLWFFLLWLWEGINWIFMWCEDFRMAKRLWTVCSCEMDFVRKWKKKPRCIFYRLESVKLTPTTFCQYLCVSFCIDLLVSGVNDALI